jgi:hypothetical protein
VFSRRHVCDNPNVASKVARKDGASSTADVSLKDADSSRTTASDGRRRRSESPLCRAAAPLQMRLLQGGDASGGKRGDDVSLRVEDPHENSADDDEIFFHGLEARLRRIGSPAAMEILERLTSRVLPAVEAALDATVTEARAEGFFLTSKGPHCLLRVNPTGESLPVEILIDCRSPQKGEKRKRR